MFDVKKIAVFVVALVVFGGVFFFMDNALQASQGLELFPSGNH